MTDDPKKKAVADFNVTDDVRRVMSMGSDPLGFNPKVNQVTDPAARTYAARIQERKAADALKGKAPPLGGAPPIDPEKAQQIAALGGGGMPAPSFGEPPPSFAQPEAPPAPRPQPPIQGVGSGFQVNQDLSQGKTDGPVTMNHKSQPAEAPRTLSPGTVQALKMATENAQKQPMPQPPQPAVPAVAQETKEELDQAADTFDDPDKPELDFKAIADARNVFLNPERKKDIESRLKPLSLAEMITKRELTQVIPIIQGEFEVTVRTVSQRESIWILQYIYDFPGSVMYTQELINTCRLVCGLVALNGALLPEHREDVGKSSEKVSREAFEKKMGYIIAYPAQLIADISVQQLWFQERVEQLFTVKALKNG